MKSTLLPTLFALLVAAPVLAQGEGTAGIRDVLSGRSSRSNPESHPILSQRFQMSTDRATGSPLTMGNRFELLETGVVAFPRKLSLIRDARHTVLFSTMIVVEDESGKEMRQALVNAAKRGVKVYAILDGNLTDPRFYARLRMGGVKVLRYNKIFARDRKARLHSKSVIVDSRIAVLGGMNMTDDYNRGDGENHLFKDTDLLVEGDAATQAALHFQSLWRALSPRNEAPEVVWQDMLPITDRRRSLARFIVQESDQGSTAIRDYFIRCFFAAEDRIIWHVNNLKPKGPLVDALKAAVDRGVRVICITNSIKATGGLYGEKIGDVWYKLLSRNRRALSEAGVELWEFDVPVHSKALVIDGVMAAVGSYNIGSSKSDDNLESTFVVYDADLVGQVEAMLDRDLARSTRWDP